MQLKKRQLRNCRLYVIIDEKTAGGKDLFDIAKKAIAGGVDILQLRSQPETPVRNILKTASAIKEAAKKTRIPFIINDRVDIAYAAGADGVHLGQDDLPVETARRILGRGKIIGISTHSVGQALKAQASGADYISIGPIFRTPTKPEYTAVGLQLIGQVRSRIKIPVFAIGGIHQENIGRIIANGASRVAVARAVIAARDVRKAARVLKDDITGKRKAE